LQQLLSWDAKRDGGTVEDVFCRNFEISYDVGGKVETFLLGEDDADVAVTEENRERYCQLYADHMLNKSIAKQFAAIQRYTFFTFALLIVCLTSLLYRRP
jgi:hypothetical protein